jgi:hypothetical protein
MRSAGTSKTELAVIWFGSWEAIAAEPAPMPKYWDRVRQQPRYGLRIPG